MNVLVTQRAEAKRQLVPPIFVYPVLSRIGKCRVSMARIKTVLTERQNTHKLAVSMENGQEAFVNEKKNIVLRKLKRQNRRFRAYENFKLKRKPLFQ